MSEIRNAGERGAELTRQLLAFSRKQVGQPRAMSLNSLIRESQGMLQRVIGEDIELGVRLDPEAWTIRADRGQLHQVLMNLVVNAREAMPGGGVLTIETRNVCEGDGRLFAALSVCDTGVGMDDRTRQHVFEPFFTTKGVSKGTGLGLATVFGVVTQAGGHLAVASQPGHGSVFNLCFPRHERAGESGGERRSERGAAVRGVGRGAAGGRPGRGAAAGRYHSAQHGIRRYWKRAMPARRSPWRERFDGEIRMMLTDVIMPGMNGRELAERMARTAAADQGRVYVGLHGPDHEPRRRTGRIGGVLAEAFHRGTVKPRTPCIGVLRVWIRAEFQRDRMREYRLDD